MNFLKLNALMLTGLLGLSFAASNASGKDAEMDSTLGQNQDEQKKPKKAKRDSSKPAEPTEHLDTSSSLASTSFVTRAVEKAVEVIDQACPKPLSSRTITTVDSQKLNQKEQTIYALGITEGLQRAHSQVLERLEDNSETETKVIVLEVAQERIDQELKKDQDDISGLKVTQAALEATQIARDMVISKLDQAATVVQDRVRALETGFAADKATTSAQITALKTQVENLPTQAQVTEMVTRQINAGPKGIKIKAGQFEFNWTGLNLNINKMTKILLCALALLEGTHLPLTIAKKLNIMFTGPLFMGPQIMLGKFRMPLYLLTMIAMAYQASSKMEQYLLKAKAKFNNFCEANENAKAIKSTCIKAASFAYQYKEVLLALTGTVGLIYFSKKLNLAQKLQLAKKLAEVSPANPEDALKLITSLSNSAV